MELSFVPAWLLNERGGKIRSLHLSGETFVAEFSVLSVDTPTLNKQGRKREMISDHSICRDRSA